MVVFWKREDNMPIPIKSFIFSKFEMFLKKANKNIPGFCLRKKKWKLIQEPSNLWYCLIRMEFSDFAIEYKKF